MSTIYMSQLSTALPLMEGSGDHHHHHHHRGHQDHHHQGHFQAFSLPKDPPLGLFPFVITSSSSSSDVVNGLGYGSDHHAMLDHHQSQHMIGGSSSSVFAAPFPTVESIRDDMIERSSSFDPYDIDKLQAAAAAGGSAAKAAAGKYWSTPAGSAPAKMRITRKASDPAPAAAKKPRRRAQAYEDNYSHSSGMNQALGVIRVCSDCNTTKTPLWRSGPCGPKSLCNACGIRQRKARRAMTMASGAAVAASGAGDAAAAVHVHPPKVKKEKRSADVDRSLPFKKRSKVVQDHTAANTAAAAPVEAAEPVVVTAAAAAPARDLAEISMGAKWSNKGPTTSAHVSSVAACFWPSAPAAVQDEITDAAMLLMTLSCDLVRS